MNSAPERQTTAASEPLSLSQAAKQIARYPHPSFWFEPVAQRRNRILAGVGVIGAYVIGAALMTWFADPEFRNQLLAAFLVPTASGGLILILSGWSMSVFFWLDRIGSFITYQGGRLLTGLAVLIMALEALTAFAGFQLAQIGHLSIDAANGAKLQLAVAAVGLSTVMMAFAGSVAAGSFIDARREQTGYLRRRFAGRVLLCAIAAAGIEAAVLVNTGLPAGDRAIPMSLVLATLFPLLRWQSQRVAHNDSTKDLLRTSTRKAYEAMQTWTDDSTKQSERVITAKRAAMTALNDLADTLKVGEITPTGTRHADSGTLIVIDYLLEALPRITCMHALLMREQGPRHPAPLEPFHELRPNELRAAAAQYLGELYRRVEDARHIRHLPAGTKAARRANPPRINH